MTLYAHLLTFIHAREQIARRRAAGDRPPWTDDPILQKYSFTNVRREEDKTTRWIAQNWRNPHADDPELFFAMTVARHLNKPETLLTLGYPVPWDPEHFRRTLKSIQARGQTILSNAYMVRAARDGTLTPDYLADQVFSPMWANAPALRPQPGDTLQFMHFKLVNCFGIGSFMAGQIATDTSFVEPLLSAPDWFFWSCPGPGSQRGLNLLHDLPINKLWKEADFQDEVNRIQAYVNPRLNSPPLRAMDVQNCLCEFSKYRQAQLGLKMPKRLYKGPNNA